MPESCSGKLKERRRNDGEEGGSGTGEKRGTETGQGKEREEVEKRGKGRNREENGGTERNRGEVREKQGERQRKKYKERERGGRKKGGKGSMSSKVNITYNLMSERMPSISAAALLIRCAASLRLFYSHCRRG